MLAEAEAPTGGADCQGERLDAFGNNVDRIPVAFEHASDDQRGRAGATSAVASPHAAGHDDINQAGFVFQQPGDVGRPFAVREGLSPVVGTSSLPMRQLVSLTFAAWGPF